MRLLQEFTDLSELEILTETDSTSREPIYRIKGPFMQAEVRNKNNRRYGLSLCEREVTKFNVDKIAKRRALGELDHPPTPTVNLQKVSHLIESLTLQSNIATGVAKLLPEMPNGRIACTLVKERILLGTSTRGVGSLEGEDVSNDYNLITIDIVADPSAPGNFVESVLENKEFIIGDDGSYIEIAVEELQHKADKYGLSKHALQFMKEFLQQVRNNL